MRVTGNRTERFDALFREHYDAVSAYARRRADGEAAQDAVAETFLVAWRRIDDVPDDALPWLLGVTRKTLANQRRSDGRGAALAQRLAEVAAGASADDPADVVTRAELMRAAFERLSERDRATLLEAAGFDGAAQPDRAAAPVTGAGAGDARGSRDEQPSRGALAVRLHRARGRLQAQVEALGMLPLLLIAIAVSSVLLLTPPGRAGVSWAIELIGIGDVGGSPTRSDRGPLEPTTGPFVVDNGRGPDGSPYEWVAHRGGLPAMRVQRGVPGWRPGDPVPDGPVRRIPAATGLCLMFEWPRSPGRRETNGCWDRPRDFAPSAIQFRKAIHSLSWMPVQARFKDVPRPDVVLTGTTTGAVDRLEISYADSAGRHRLPVDFARVDGALLRRLGLPPGKPGPFGVFTAFVGGRLAARDRLTDRYPQWELLVDRRLRTGFPATDACLRRRGRPPVGPFELRAYASDGRLIDVRRTLDGDAMPRPCVARWYAERPR